MCLCNKENAMRRLLLLPLAVAGLLLGLASACRAEDDAKTILDKAIKAHGGEEKLKKLKAGKSKVKGTLTINDTEVDFTEESIAQLPDKLKDTLSFEIMNTKITVVTIINADKASVKVNNKEEKLNDKAKAEVKEAGHLLRVSRLLGLKDKKYTLSTLGEMKVEGKPALGIKVAAKGFRDIDLYFDKKTGLLVQTNRRGVDPQSGQEYAEERIVKEYQTVNGLPAAKKVLVKRDGKKFSEVEVVEVKMLDKVDENEFTLP
jgi:hypothetical protein